MTAKELYREANNQFDCGNYLEAKRFFDETYALALTEAKTGGAEALCLMGDLCKDTRVGHYDVKKAMEWYKEAAVKGHAVAQSKLSLVYKSTAHLLAHNEVEAAQLAELAAEGGCVPAMASIARRYETGRGVDINMAKAMHYYQRAAESGYATAQEQLGSLYHRGAIGVPQDQGKAFSWFQKAAEQNSKEAQFMVGLFYERGWGVEKDPTKSFYWYHKSAQAGLKEAQHNLGHCYYSGEGVEKDFKQAFYWFSEAAKQGYAGSQFNLGICYMNAIGTSQDYEQAEQWLLKAKQQGYKDALRELGTLYYEKHNYKKASDYWTEAAKGGDKVAAENLQVMIEQGFDIGCDVFSIIKGLLE